MVKQIRDQEDPYDAGETIKGKKKKQDDASEGK